MSTFFKELKERKVIKAIISYAVVTFVIMQLVEILFPIFELPAWASKFVILLLLISFPIVLFISWTFDFSRDGIRKEKSNTSNMAVVVIIGLVVSFIIYRIVFNNNNAHIQLDNKYLAILPFNNFSKNPGDEYLSDGMTEDITMQLAKIKDLNVISRTSVMQYKEEKKNIKKIANELGVNFILEGSVRRVNENIRVVTQLIDASLDKHIWSDSYDTDINGVLNVHKTISEVIAEKLLGNLTKEEKQSLQSFSTKSHNAHNHYIIAKNLVDRGLSADRYDFLEQAISELINAIKLDNNFVEAYSLLVEAHLLSYWISYDRTPRRLEKAKEILDKVRNKGQGNPFYHRAQGLYHYWGFRNYALALQEFDKALEINPNYADVLETKAYIFRRLGKYSEAIELFQRAKALNPNSYGIYNQIVYTQLRTGQHDGVKKEIENGITKSVDNVSLRLAKIWVELEQSGNINVAINSINELYQITGSEIILPVMFDFYLTNGNMKLAEETAKKIPDAITLNRQYYMYKPITKNMALGIVFHKQSRYSERDSYLIPEIEIIKQKLLKNPGDHELHRRLGIAYAYLGKNTEAIFELRLAVSMLDIGVDALYGPFYLYSLAEANNLIGNKAESKRIIDRLVQLEAGIFNYDYEKSWRWKS